MTVNFVESAEGTSQLIDGQEPALLCRYTSLSKSTLQLLPVLKRLADERLHAPCLITDFVKKDDSVWEVRAETPDGKIHHLPFNKREILNLTPYEDNVKVFLTFQQTLKPLAIEMDFLLRPPIFLKTNI